MPSCLCKLLPVLQLQFAAHRHRHPGRHRLGTAGRSSDLELAGFVEADPVDVDHSVARWFLGIGVGVVDDEHLRAVWRGRDAAMARPGNTDVEIRRCNRVLFGLHPRAERLVRRGVADPVVRESGVIGRVGHVVAASVLQHEGSFVAAILGVPDLLPRLVGFHQLHRLADRLRQVVGQRHAVHDPEAVAVLNTVSAEIEIRLAVVIDEDVAVDGGIAEVEPRGVQVTVRPLGLVADGQSDQQSRWIAGFVHRTVGHVELAPVELDLGSPVVRLRPGVVRLPVGPALLRPNARDLLTPST